jgi:chemotaxis protein MotB
MTTRPTHGPLVLLLAAGLVSGCVSTGTYRALESRSAAERDALQQQVATLDAQRLELEAQKESLEGELAAQRDEMERVQRALEGLSEQLALVERQAELTGAKKDEEARQLKTLRDKLSRDIEVLNEQMAAVQRQAQLASAQKDEEIKRLKGTYDSLVKDLEGEIQKGEIKVTQIRDRLTVNLVEKVLFDSGRAEVKPAGKTVLKKVGAILKEVTDKQIRIEGSTDNVPIGERLRARFPTNWELSTQRATTVLRFLEEDAGVNGAHLAAVGYGPHRPIASNDTPEGRAENRRIEIVLVPADIQEVLKELE